MTPAIALEKFSLRYSAMSHWALSDLTFQIPRGSCCAILGQTGAGKSTLLHTLSGLLGKHHRSAESSGSLQVMDSGDISLPRESLFPRVGMVLQDPYVMVSGLYETVDEEISFTLQNLNYSRDQISHRVQQTLATLNLETFASRHPTHLSGGEVQRVALACILVAQPDILLLDEPRNSLDSAGQETVARIIKDFRGKTTVLFTDYQIDLALAIADHILVLDGGRCIFNGNKSAFLKHNEEFTSILIPDEWKDVIPALAAPTSKAVRNSQRIAKLFGLDYA
ncbi:MAG TPA: ABC transporter ATP-binding protein [Bacteroidota bacterium]